MWSLICLAWLWLMCASASAAEPVDVRFDFRIAETVVPWKAQHDIAQIESIAEGMRVKISGSDPYLAGPPTDFPADVPLLLKLRVRSEAGGMCQLFFFETSPSEKRSVRVPVPAGRWFDGIVALPSLGPKTRFRIDPPGDRGDFLIEQITIGPRLQLAQPDWPAPTLSNISNDLVVKSGSLTLVHSRDQFGGFTLQAAGMQVVGNNQTEIIYLHEGKDRHLSFKEGSQVVARKEGERLIVTASKRDLDGATWLLQHEFQADGLDGISVRCELSVNHDRDLLFAPLLIMHPGLKTFGETKTQALLAGVEYLENESSSSEADLVGPAANRRVPDNLKLTFPLMALSADDSYVGLIWRRHPDIAALFDSPDRVWKSGAHVMGLIAPGSDGLRRADGELFPHAPTKLSANQPLHIEATLVGGRGKTVTPAVQQYVARRFSKDRALPAVSKDDYVRVTAAGWLDSPIRDGAAFRHAVAADAQQFGAHPTGDVPWMLRWLASQTRDPAIAQQLKAVSTEALAKVSPPQEYVAHIGHLHLPVTPLLTGHIVEALPHVRLQGRNLLKRINDEGVVPYHAAPKRPDFGRTHWEQHANGMTGEVVYEALLAAAFSGDQELLRDALTALKTLNRYDNTVPRGAQTWEIPLHTPDILAAAHLVNAYRLGYQLTGDVSFRERAEYWAWTGLAFVYLDNPTSDPIGKFATIAVLGATNWESPVWIGLPVQWCGLAYANALHGLGGEWSHIADGIAASAIQQNYPLNHPHRGLLPDSFSMQTQTRNPSDINPGTLQPVAMRLFEPHRPAYDFAAIPGESPVMVHVPGKCEQLRRSSRGDISFVAKSWIDGEYSVLVHGVPSSVQVAINGRATELTKPHEYMAATRSLVLRISGDATVELKVP